MNRVRQCAIVLSLVACACGGGSGGENPTGPSPSTTSSFSSTSQGGNPSEHDWADLAAEFTSIAVTGLHEAIAPSPSAAAPGFGLLNHGAGQLPAPSQPITFVLGYFCCGGTTRPISQVSYGGNILAVRDGIVKVTASIDQTSFRWTSRDGSRDWVLHIPNGVAVTAEFLAGIGLIDNVQRMRMVGTLERDQPTGGRVPERIELDLSFSNIFNAAPSATGTFGSLQPGGRTLPATPSSQRCSLPREGCGPLVSGNYPCTKWPPCQP